MKHSLLLVVLATTLGITACSKPASAPAYSGPNKAAYDAAVEKCKAQPFDARDKCVKAEMDKVAKPSASAPSVSAPAASAPAAPAAPAPAAPAPAASAPAKK